ncbi:MAG: hypothetical protein H6R14_1397 [Proteobacteria bacterium]|nr:hypothetical protein [Pseudomonadota bacterium]
MNGPAADEHETEGLSSPAADDRHAHMSEASTSPQPETQRRSPLVTVVVWIYRLIVLGFGLLLVMGGGVLGLCGANGRGNDWILIVIGLVPLALGGLLIVSLFKTNRKVDRAQSTRLPKDGA